LRVLVCGGRDFKDKDFVFDYLTDTMPNPVTIISGWANGPDSFAVEWASDWEQNVMLFPAKWVHYGNRAGPIRNEEMLKDGKPDLVVAFPGGSGTAHMVKIAKAAGVKVIEVEYP
jgi:hypothetical protein